jgi:hypothetical protein
VFNFGRKFSREHGRWQRQQQKNKSALCFHFSFPFSIALSYAVYRPLGSPQAQP